MIEILTIRKRIYTKRTVSGTAVVIAYSTSWKIRSFCLHTRRMRSEVHVASCATMLFLLLYFMNLSWKRPFGHGQRANVFNILKLKNVSSQRIQFIADFITFLKMCSASGQSQIPLNDKELQSARSPSKCSCSIAFTFIPSISELMIRK